MKGTYSLSYSKARKLIKAWNKLYLDDWCDQEDVNFLRDFFWKLDKKVNSE